jgi:hypothetical protein
MMVRCTAGVRLGRAAAHPLLPQPLASPAVAAAAAAAACLAVLPGPGQQLLVGCASGAVLRAACVGVPSAPSEFVPQLWQRQSPAAAGADCTTSGSDQARASGRRGARTAKAGAVTAIAVSPACPNAFLVAHACGTLHLHSASRSHAVLAWPGFSSSGWAAVRWG